MPNQEENLFAPDSFGSGLLTDFEFYVTSASFIRDAQYNNGQTTQLNLVGRAVKDEVLVKDDMEVRYNLPPDWVSKDGGETVVSEKDGANFNRNSQVAKLFTKVWEVAPEVPAKWHSDGETPMIANIWVGTGWLMKEVSEKYKIEGQERETIRNFPAAFLGWFDAGEISGHGQAPDPAEAENTLIQSLKPLALAHDSHEDFVNAAIAMDGVTGYPGLVKRLADPDDLYASLRASE